MAHIYRLGAVREGCLGGVGRFLGGRGMRGLRDFCSIPIYPPCCPQLCGLGQVFQLAWAPFSHLSSTVAHVGHRLCAKLVHK